MNSSIFLTLFVIISGVFTFWCSFKNYNWFFEAPGLSRLFIYVVGRQIARGIYLIFSVFFFGWGLLRIVSPPENIPVDFIYDLARPKGIEISNVQTSTLELLRMREDVYGVHADEQGWISFWYDLAPVSPFFSDAVASTKAGPDFHEGFAFRVKDIGDKKVGGRIIYFDSTLTSCDNFLFSDHPLDSASFAMIICSPEASRHNGGEGSLTIFYCRAGSPLYRRLVR